MDNIAEQLVKKKVTGADWAKVILVSIGALLIASFLMFLAIALMIFVLVIPAVLVLWGGIHLIGNFSVEYEYIVTNNDLDIDKVIGQRKRKRMISLDIKTAEDFGDYPPAEDVTADVAVHASSGLAENASYMIFDTADHGKVKLIFNPNEKIREAIMQEVSGPLRIKLRRNGK